MFSLVKNEGLIEAVAQLVAAGHHLPFSLVKNEGIENGRFHGEKIIATLADRLKG